MKIRLSPTARALFRLYSTSLAMSLSQGMTIPTIQVIRSEFHLSVGLAAQIGTALGLGALAAVMPAGIIVDRLGRKTAMLLGATLVAAGAFITAATPYFSVMLMAQFVTGAGDVLWFMGREVAGVDLVRPEQRGRLMSGFMGISSAGMALGPVLGGILTEQVDFRAVFWTYGAIAVAVVLITLVAKESWSGEVRATPRSLVAGLWALVKLLSLGLVFTLTNLLNPATFLLTLGRIVGLIGLVRRLGRLPQILNPIEPRYRATYITLVFATFAMMLYRMTLQIMLPLYADTRLGFSPTQVGSLFLISSIFVFVMIIPTGFITDKIGRKWATVPSTALPAVVFAAMPFAHSMLQLSLLAVVIGMANGMSLGSYATSTYDIVPAAGRGRFQSIRRTFGEVGRVSGPALGGIIANASHAGRPFLFFAPLLFLAALLLLFVARESLVKERRPAPT